jgi:hypothetical protein
MDMRRFVPGVDAGLATGIPASLMRSSELGSNGDGPHDGIGDVRLITERATTLIDKYRQLCYWRQVVNAENN